MLLTRFRRAVAAVGSRRKGAIRGQGTTGQILLDYADAGTKVRATEAPFQDPRLVADGGTGAYPWAFVGSSEPTNWLGSGVMRVFSDGAILIEGARTNKMPESDLDTWTLIGDATVSTDDATAPDADTNADTITFTALATDAITHETTIDAGAGSDNDAAVVSCWLRSTSGTEEARIGLMDKGTTTRLLSSDLTITTTWARFEFEVADIGAGVAAPDGLIQNSSDAAARSIEAWGFQVEHTNGFPSSDIRAAGAAATRNLDDVAFDSANVPAVMKSGKWTVDVWPNWTHQNVIDDADNRAVFAWGASNSNIIWFLPNVGACKLRVRIGASNIITGNVLTFSARQKLALTFDSITGTLEVSGATTGDGVSGSTPWTAPAGDLQVGNRDTGTRPFNGVISQPRAA